MVLFLLRDLCAALQQALGVSWYSKHWFFAAPNSMGRNDPCYSNDTTVAVGILLLSYLENFPTQILILSAVWRSATQMKLCWICEKETCKGCTAASVKYQLSNARVSTSKNPCPCLGHTQLWPQHLFAVVFLCLFPISINARQGLLKSSGHALYLHIILFLGQNWKPKTIPHLILKLSYPPSFVPLCR